MTTMIKTQQLCGTKKRETKKQMMDGELCLHFQSSLEKHTECGNKDCDYLQILSNNVICPVVALYLVWFERETKHEQDCILFDWYKCANFVKRWHNWYLLLYNAIDVDDEDPIMKELRSWQLCTLSIRKVMHLEKGG